MNQAMNVNTVVFLSYWVALLSFIIPPNWQALEDFPLANIHPDKHRDLRGPWCVCVCVFVWMHFVSSCFLSSKTTTLSYGHNRPCHAVCGHQGSQWERIRLSMQETPEIQAQSLCWEDPLEQKMPTHSRIIAWRIPWTEEPGGLQFMGSQRVGHDWAHTHPRIPEHLNVWTSIRLVSVHFYPL